MIIYGKEHGIEPNKEIGKELNDLLASLKDNDDKKEVVLEQGTYYIDADHCPERIYHVTNTTAEKEYDPGEKMWARKVAILFEGVKNLTFSGNHSTFVIDGICDNVDLDGCENVTLRDFEIKVNKPNVHKLTVVGRSLTKLTLQPGPDENVVEEDGEIYFIGKDYKHPLMMHVTQPYFNSADPDRPTYFTRTLHPLLGTRSREYKNGVIVAKGLFPKKRFPIGREYFIYDNRRKHVGIFAQGCKNLTLQNLTQRFSYSLALVCQDCDGLTFDGLDMSPESVERFGFVSVADFMHLCCCRGQITIRNGFFSSSGDDVLNVHGIHFKVISADKNKISVRFCHGQAYGFNIFRPGDEIAFIDRSSLLEQGKAVVRSSKLVDLYTVELTLDGDVEPTVVGNVVENVSACPDVLFEKNRFERISTRGILLTTRGRVIVRENEFTFTKMWAIEVADDGRDWYESGMICDLTVEDNRFVECTQEMIHVFPHNLVHKGYVHNNITIRNNEFHLKRKHCYIVRSAGNVRFVGNRYIAPLGYRKYLFKITADIAEKDF